MSTINANQNSDGDVIFTLMWYCLYWDMRHFVDHRVRWLSLVSLLLLSPFILILSPLFLLLILSLSPPTLRAHRVICYNHMLFGATYLFAYFFLVLLAAIYLFNVHLACLFALTTVYYLNLPGFVIDACRSGGRLWLLSSYLAGTI